MTLLWRSQLCSQKQLQWKNTRNLPLRLNPQLLQNHQPLPWIKRNQPQNRQLQYKQQPFSTMNLQPQRACQTNCLNSTLKLPRQNMPQLQHPHSRVLCHTLYLKQNQR
uniref:Uncharacterized protein n=1 Tax=Cacopsylla melanoneura TaxID=428564 RepID=A0A8D8Z722_9HEMI